MDAVRPAAPERAAAGAASRAGDIALGALALLAAAWLLTSLAWPLGFDLGLYAWTGDVVARGGLPYRDAWDMHGPLVAHLYAIPRVLAGNAVWAVRVLDMLFLAAALAALWSVVRAATTARAATWTVVVFVLFYGSLTFNETAQPESWVGAMVMAAMAGLLAGREATPRRLLVAGLVVGASTLVKPFYAVFLALPALALLFDAPRDVRRLVIGVAAAVLGFAVPLIVTAAYFAARGALDELLEVHLLYTARVYSGTTAIAIGSRVRGLVEFVLRFKVVAVALPAAAIGAAVLWRTHRRSAALLLAWIALATFCVLLQNKFYPYHWHPVFLPITVLAAIGVHALWGAATTAHGDTRFVLRAAVVSLVGVIVLHASIRPATYAAQRALHVARGGTDASYYARFDDGGPVRPVDDLRAARHIAARTKPTDGIAIWGFDAGILFLADRPTPFRMAGWFWPVTAGNGTEVRTEYRREYMESMRTRPPEYVVVHRPSAELPNMALDEFPEFQRLLATAYARDTVFGGLELHRRLHSPAPAP